MMKIRVSVFMYQTAFESMWLLWSGECGIHRLVLEGKMVAGMVSLIMHEQCSVAWGS